MVAQRGRPPELAGLWELPGGKVAPGESDAAGLARELREELGADVRVTLAGGAVRPHDHRALRWVTADELESLAWVPADRAWLGALAEALRDAS